MKEKKIVLNDEQQRVVDDVILGKSVFLTGGAGTGKSTVINECRRLINKNIAVVSPTGISASLIGGVTIHSFFRIKPGVATKANLYPLSDPQKEVLRNVDLLIVDEISMIRSDTFCAMSQRFQEVALPERCHLPFGGVQLLVSGDFAQLPPVVQTWQENTYLAHKHGGVYSFKTDLWSEVNFTNHVLTEVHRQAAPLFCDLLNSVRLGKVFEHNFFISETGETVDALTALNYYAKISPDCIPEGSTAICTLNSLADGINSLCSYQLPGQCVAIHADVCGVFPESEFPTKLKLELKVGAEVIMLSNQKNSDDEYLYNNGSRGKIASINHHTLDVYVEIENGPTVIISPASWEKYEYRIRKDESTEELEIFQHCIGSFQQLPIKLAYGSTIQSQGMSLDRTHVCLGPGAFAPGQLYTALSRCRAIESLSLDRPLKVSDVIVDPDIIQFIENLTDSK